MFTESRSRLRWADRLQHQKRYADVIAIYQSVAQDYTDWGFALKAIAVSRVIVEIVDQYAPDLAAERAIALKRLLSLQIALGLDDQAEQMCGILSRN
jgi:hypothetical protein